MTAANFIKVSQSPVWTPITPKTGSFIPCRSTIKAGAAVTILSVRGHEPQDKPRSHVILLLAIDAIREGMLPATLICGLNAGHSRGK